MTTMQNRQWMRGNKGGDVGKRQEKTGEKLGIISSQLLEVKDQDIEMPHSRL